MPPDGFRAKISFVADGNLFVLARDARSATCVPALERSASSLQWSPKADRVLVDADLIVDGMGASPSGFAPTTVGISWSQPTGKALIAPSADGQQLVHVAADDPGDITDIAALTTTWAAAYHPSGEAVIAAGVAPDGIAGLFLADNRGDRLQPLATLDDPTHRITQVAVAGSGGIVFFVHDHGDGGAHVHQLTIPGLNLLDLTEHPDGVPSDLTTSNQADWMAGWIVDHSTAHSTTHLSDGTHVRAVESRAQPVGVFGDGAVLLLVRSVGTTDDTPGDLWLLSATDEAELIVTGVTAAAARTVRGPLQQLPDDIEAQAPG